MATQSIWIYLICTQYKEAAQFPHFFLKFIPTSDDCHLGFLNMTNHILKYAVAMPKVAHNVLASLFFGGTSDGTPFSKCLDSTRLAFYIVRKLFFSSSQSCFLGGRNGGNIELFIFWPWLS